MRQNREVEFRFEPIFGLSKETNTLFGSCVVHTKAIIRLSVVE